MFCLTETNSWCLTCRTGWEEQSREAAERQVSLRGIMSTFIQWVHVDQDRLIQSSVSVLTDSGPLKPTGLSASVQTPAPAHWKTSFFIALHVGALWMSHAWAASTEARRTQLSVTFLSTQLESARPLLNPSDEPRCPRGAFLLHSASRWDFIRPLVVLHSARTVLMRLFTRGAAWLTLTRPGSFLQTMAGCYRMSRSAWCRTASGREAALHVYLTHTHTLPLFIRSQLDSHIMDDLPVLSLLMLVFWACWLRLVPPGCSAEEADPLSAPNINVMSFLL